MSGTMERLTPLPSEQPPPVISARVTEELVNLIDAERVRINARSRSEVMRLILEMYFDSMEVMQ